MARKANPSTQSEQDEAGSRRPTSPPSFSQSRESQVLKLSEGQRRTILEYAELPAHLFGRLAAEGMAARSAKFTLDELDELLDHIEWSVYRAKGNEKQKVLRIVEKVSKLLGSTINPDDMPGSRRAKKTDTVFQVKITLKGIDPPIWRRIQTRDCTLAELHEIIQITMGWEFEHLYQFHIGGVRYADLGMTDFDDAEDTFDTKLSEVLPPGNRRPRFDYEYDFGDGWIHRLIVEERFPPESGGKYPICVAGQRACPPEDSGGPWAYPEFVAEISNPDHSRHDGMLEWVGGEFDPERFDRAAVNGELRRMRAKKT
jgi:hypothetical protein